MRRARRAWVLAAMLLLGVRGVRPDACRAGGEDSPPVAPPPAAAKEVDLTTWEGFLWWSAEGWTRIGTPLTSEQVMDGAPLVVEPPLANRMRSIEGSIPVFVKEAQFWYGTELARDDWEPQRRGEPRILVKVRGQAESTIVHLSLPDASPYFGGEPDEPGPYGREAPPISLRNARLVAIERLDERWLAAWRTILRAEGSTWRGGKDALEPSDDARAALVKTAIEALSVMRAVVPANGDLQLAARKIDADARISSKFRHRIEWSIQRELISEAKKLRMTLPAALADRMPPPSYDAGRWFEDAKTRTAFLARAALNWTGDPEDLDVTHYVSDGLGRRWQQLADLETIRHAWSDARYVKIRATTLEVAAEDAARAAAEKARGAAEAKAREAAEKAREPK